MNRDIVLKGRYRIIKELRSEAFGKAYVAIDKDLPSHSQCIVKQLDFSSYDPQSLQEVGHLFEKEAKILEKLGKHSQFPQLFAYFEHNKKFYIIQELIQGNSLANEFLQEPILSENQVINLLIEVLEIVVFMHQNNFIHRNIKPDNLIRRSSDGKLVLLDLEGIKEIGAQSGNQRIGTPGYIPKEQYEGNPKLCSDIYAVGMIGIQACTGKLLSSHPHVDVVSEVNSSLSTVHGSEQSTINNQQVDAGNSQEHIASPPSKGEWHKSAQVSPRLAAVIDKMVCENWQERYQSAQEVLDELIKVRCVDLIPAPIVSTFIIPDYIKKFGLLKGVGVVAVLAVVTGTSAIYMAYSVGKLEGTEGSDLQVLKKGETNLSQRNYEECLKQTKIIRQSSSYYSKAQDVLQKCNDGVNWKNAEVQTFKEHSDKVWDVAFSPDKKTFASSSRDQTIKIWNWPGMKVRDSLEKGHTHSVLSIAFSPDSRLLASGGADMKVNLWKPRTMEVVYTKWHGKWVWAVAISPDGKMIASGSEDRSIKLWNLATGEQWPYHRLPGSNSAHTSTVYALAFSPDSKTLVSGSADKTIKIWDLVHGKPPHILKGHTDTVRAIALSPDGQILVSGSWDQTIKVWNLKKEQLTNTLRGHSNRVTCVAISPDGKTLASGSLDQTIKIWNLQSGKLLNTLTGHSGEVLSLAFSQDGKALASGGADKTVKIWQR